MERLSRWIGHKHWSLIMMLIGLIGFGIATHPSLFGALLILLLSAWWLLALEVAHAEGAAAATDSRGTIDYRRLIAAGVIAVLTIIAMTHINWLAL
jgi:hypothetical protein